MFCAILSYVPPLSDRPLVVATTCRPVCCRLWSWSENMSFINNLRTRCHIHTWKSIFVYVNVEIYLLCSSAFTLFLLCILCVWCWSSAYRARHILLCTHTDYRFGSLQEDRPGVFATLPEWSHSSEDAPGFIEIFEELRSAKYLIALHAHRSSSMILWVTWASVWYLFWIVDGLMFSHVLVFCALYMWSRSTAAWSRWPWRRRSPIQRNRLDYTDDDGALQGIEEVRSPQTGCSSQGALNVLALINIGSYIFDKFASVNFDS